MREFKKIKLAPLTNVEDLKLNIASQKELDVTTLQDNQQEEVIAAITKWIHDKSDGNVIVAGGLSGEKPHVMTQIRAGQNKKKIFSFPEPNPVQLYFRNANIHLEKAYKGRISFNAIPDTNPQQQGQVFSEFFSDISFGIVGLIMTVEGFINQLLSDNIKYNIGGEEKTKSDIEWFDFNKKIRLVIPVISGIDYIKDYKDDYDNLSLTNSLRDDLIHLKRIEEDNLTNYESLFKRLLDFDPINASNSVFSFANTIQANYFEEQNDM